MRKYRITGYDDGMRSQQEPARPRTGAPTPIFVEAGNGVRYPSPKYARAFLGLVRAGESLQRGLDAELRRGHGIGLRGFEILLHLVAFAPDGHRRMTQLTEQAPLSQSRVSRLVSELEAQGLVSRSNDDLDTRGVLVTITDRGLDTLREAQETHYRGLQERLFSRLTAREIDQLARLTAKIADNPGIASAPPGGAGAHPRALRLRGQSA